jgi:lysophospholipase L1-like esterase
MLLQSLLRPVLTPLMRGMFDAPIASSAAWSPASQIARYSSASFANLFQDTAGAVPVTAVGQTVKRINDISGAGHHLTNSTGWILSEDSGFRYLIADGASYFESAAFDFVTDKLTIFAAIRANDFNSVVSFGSVAAETGSFDFGGFLGNILLYRRGSGTFGARSGAAADTGDITLSTHADLSGTDHQTETPTLHLNGVQSAAFTDYAASDSGGGNFGVHALKLGGGGGGLYSGRIYEVVVCNAVEDLADGDAYMEGFRAIPDPFSEMVFLDTGSQATVDGAYQLSSTFSHADFQTTATLIELDGYTNIPSIYPTYAEIAVFVDGVWNHRLRFSANGYKSGALTLPAGDKVVSFVNGLQSTPSSTRLGTWVTRVSANAAMTPITDGPVDRVLVYGESIAVGGNADITTKEAWVILLRQAYAPKSVALEGSGYRALFSDCHDSTARAAFVAKMVAYAPARIWLAIGTNDYGLNQWSAASFGTAYAALLDDLHAALPSALIYAQTPLLRSSEAANPWGSTLGDYRAQISTAVSTRTGYCTLVDGTAIMTTGDLVDGIHPSTAGHALYAAYVQTVLGIP